MKYNLVSLSVIATMLALAGCSEDISAENKSSAAASQEVSVENTLLQEWKGPYQGLPAFDTVKLSDLKPALETAMAENLAEMDAITNNPDAPTFENTIVALERSGKLMNRVGTFRGIWRSNMSTSESREINAEMAPVLSAFYSKITQNEALFARIKAVYASGSATGGPVDV